MLEAGGTEENHVKIYLCIRYFYIYTVDTDDKKKERQFYDTEFNKIFNVLTCNLVNTQSHVIRKRCSIGK